MAALPGWCVTLAALLPGQPNPTTDRDDGVFALGGATLAIGDPAPPLAVQEFVRGQAVQAFDRGTVYVVEFWKCGCPPCRAAIPHLNDLQKKYPSVVFISVGVYTPTAENIELVRRAGGHMGYRVAVDRVPPGKDPYTCGAMVQTWLEPAGEEGVPVAFIIDGRSRIAWVGPPTSLDDSKAGNPLTQVTSGKWAPAAAERPAAARSSAASRRVDQLPDAERDAVNAIHGRADRVVVDIRGNTVTGMRLSPARVTDAMLSGLACDFQKLPSLRDLDLCGTDLSDEGLKSLRGLTAVEILDISSTRVTDAGLASLRTWANLQVLRLRSTLVSAAGLKQLDGMPKLATLDLSGLPMTADGLKALTGLPELHVLNLSGTGVTDGMLKELRGARGLHGLDLSDTPITDSGVRELKGMRLGFLSLKNTRVEGRGLAELEGLIEGLNLSGTRVVDAELSHLKRFPNLRRLVLDQTRVTDAGLVELGKNQGLRSLSLTDTRVTDAGLPGLRSLKGLVRLELGGTGVTDGGLREVEQFKGLSFLDASRSMVTRAGVDALRTALPNLEIAY